MLGIIFVWVVSVPCSIALLVCWYFYFFVLQEAPPALLSTLIGGTTTNIITYGLLGVLIHLHKERKRLEALLPANKHG